MTNPTTPSPLHPEIVAAIEQIDLSLEDLQLIHSFFHSVKEQVLENPNVTIYGAVNDSDDLPERIGMVGWNAKENRVELFAFWSQVEDNYVKEGLNPDDAPSWISLKDKDAFVKWLREGKMDVREKVLTK
jgi:hypothetical protein